MVWFNYVMGLYISLWSMSTSQPHSLPFMTGVKTAMPAKFGLVTVLSRIKPPTLQCHMRASHTQITAQFAITTNDIVLQGKRWWSAVKCCLLMANSNLGGVGVCWWEVQNWVRLFGTMKWLTDGSTCWWPWQWWLVPNQSRAVLWWKGSSWQSAPTGGTWPQRLHTPAGWHSRCILCGKEEHNDVMGIWSLWCFGSLTEGPCLVSRWQSWETGAMDATKHLNRTKDSLQT